MKWINWSSIDGSVFKLFRLPQCLCFFGLVFMPLNSVILKGITWELNHCPRSIRVRIWLIVPNSSPVHAWITLLSERLTKDQIFFAFLLRDCLPWEPIEAISECDSNSFLVNLNDSRVHFNVSRLASLRVSDQLCGQLIARTNGLISVYLLDKLRSESSFLVWRTARHKGWPRKAKVSEESVGYRVNKNNEKIINLACRETSV